jgi:fermentation-respiration switch protein FrsA (DUF1100 family)
VQAIGRLLAIGALALLSGCLQSVFYQPDRILYDTPERAGLKFEQVVFPSKDGTRLIGWFIPAAGYGNPRNAKGTVVHFHGNAQNLSAHWQFVEWLPRRGYNVFVFDYRGYGGSEGDPEPRGVYQDSMSALDYVRSRADVDPQKLVILGQSLGGANAIAVVGSGNRAGVKAIAIEATFYSYSSIANEKVSGTGSFMDDTYAPERFIAALAPMPFLLIHGTADQVIPYSNSKRLIEKAGEPKRLVTIEGGGHLAAFAPEHREAYAELLVEFFDSALAR